MKQFHLQNNLITLSVRKSPIIIRAVLFLFAFAFFFFPTIGMVVSLSSGDGFHFFSLIVIGFFLLLGFYLLRIALWNTYGEDSILISKDTLAYEANYGWFKDAKKTIDFENIEYSILSVGYEEDHQGLLVIENGKTKIECAVKMPKQQLEELILLVSKTY